MTTRSRTWIIVTATAIIFLGSIAVNNICRNPEEIVISTPTPVFTPPVIPLVTSVPTAVAGISLVSVEADFINRINAERAATGLPSLIVDLNLMDIARLRSIDMASRGYFGHTNPEGQSAFTLLDQGGIPYSWAGENLARNNYILQETVTVAVTDLMASPSHRDNILSSWYTRIGVGYAEDGSGMRFFTIIFVG